MKLKKIVSLALAGVLAVSMLAGCKGDATNNAGSSSSETTTVGGYTATIYDLTKSNTQSVMKTKNNTTLTAAFDEVERVFESDYIAAFKGVGTNALTLVDTANTNGSKQICDALKGKLGSNYVIQNDTVMETPPKNEDKVFVNLYCISAETTDTVLDNMVAAKVDALMANVKTNVSGSDTVDYYLTVDKFTEGTVNNGATIVMIAIERDTTKA